MSVGLADYKINIMEYGKEIRIDDFILEIYCMTHSIPESNAVMIKTKQGNIFIQVIGNLTQTFDRKTIR